jgi:RNA polymerase sigma-70 factor (ECF subfamily)
MPTIDDLDRHLPAIVVGDADAFGRWVAGAEPILRRSLRAFATAVDAEAILQETLLRVWQIAPRCRSDGNPNGLLRLGLCAARNLAISELRRQRSALVELEELEKLANRDVDAWSPPDPHLRQAIADCQKKLPKQPRSALAARLQNAGSDSDNQLAAALGMRLNTFLQNITRARKLLTECLGRAGIDLAEEMS